MFSFLLFSENTFKELTHVLFRKKFSLNNEELTRLLKIIESKSSFIVTSEQITLCRDKEDNKVLECAIAGKADFIITGDKDLLTLDKFKDISIVTPADFFKRS